MRDSLLFEACCTGSIIDARVDRMLYASLFLGLLAIIPAIKRTDEITGNAAKALKLATEVFFIGIHVFLSGLDIAILCDEGGTSLNEAANMEVFVVF